MILLLLALPSVAATRAGALMIFVRLGRDLTMDMSDCLGVGGEAGPARLLSVIVF